MKQWTQMRSVCRPKGPNCGHCRSLSDDTLRRQLLRAGMVRELDFVCPFGIGWDYEPEQKPEKRIGDHLERILKPFGRAFHSECLDEYGNLIAGSPCAKKRDALNTLETDMRHEFARLMQRLIS